MNTEFDDVMWLNILLNTNVKDIKNICLTNTTTKVICNDKHFWEQKMKYDGIIKISSFESTSYIDWVKEYTKWYEINKKADDFLKRLKSEHERTNQSIKVFLYLNVDDDVRFILTNHKDGINKVLAETDLKDAVEQNLFIQLYKNNDESIIVMWYFDDRNGDIVAAAEKEIENAELKDILVKLLYYYPNVIMNANIFSY